MVESRAQFVWKGIPQAGPRFAGKDMGVTGCGRSKMKERDRDKDRERERERDRDITRN